MPVALIGGPFLPTYCSIKRLGLVAGVDFDQRVVRLGKATSVRFAGHANFPRQIPVPEGAPLLDTQVDRLGLKTAW